MGSRGAWAPSTRHSNICGAKGCKNPRLPGRRICESCAEPLDRVRAVLDAEAAERSYNSRAAKRKRDPEEEPPEVDEAEALPEEVE